MKTLLNTLFGLAILCLIALGLSSCNNLDNKGEVAPTADTLSQKDSIWMTVEIGTLRSIEALNKELALHGFDMDTIMINLIGERRLFTTKRAKLDLVVRSVADLGFDGPTSMRSVYFRAMQQGLDLCPPEVGPYLLLMYHGKPLPDDQYQRLHLAMDPLDLDNHIEWRFEFIRYSSNNVDQGLPEIRLQMNGQSQNHFFSPEQQFVFVSKVHNRN